ncbi:MAG: hypothetical protein MOGMAGMI_00623 [Candidatus Omnitrophica bacterium]|nr:hypothetical protein [Candidatus Omnitrophota bacterium]
MKIEHLSELGPGRAGVVEGYDVHDQTTERLRELGLVSGTRVQVKRLAPLGDPMELFLRGYCLSVRLEDAARIRVRLEA